MAANLAFLFWVGRIWYESTTGTGSPSMALGGGPADAAKADKKAVLTRDLGVHLPLAGMEQAGPTDPDACLRLEGFLIDANHHLSKASVDPPRTRAQIKEMVGHKLCSITDPPVAPVIAAYRAAWVAADLDEVGPFTDD